MDSDSSSLTAPKISRRTVLRRGAGITAAGIIGVGGFTGTVAATNVCPRSPGYWGNHWHDHLDGTITIPPAGEMTKSQIQNLLLAPTRGDKVNIMAKQYLATYLNLWLRQWDDPNCSDKVVYIDGIGSVTWVHVKNAAQAWLRWHEWDGTHHSGQMTWDPEVDVLRDYQGADAITLENGDDGDVIATVDGETLKDALDAFNNNRFDELDCNCDGNDDVTNGPPTNKGPADKGPADTGPPSDKGPTDTGPPSDKGPAKKKGP